MRLWMRQRTVVLVALLAALVPSAAAVGADDPDTIVGSNGRVYPAAPAVVRGTHGELFWGRAFDLYCADGSGNFAHAFDQLAKLSKVIRRSGPRVVFTVAPDKVHVLGQNLVRCALPHGRCDRRGIRAHEKLLDTYRDPSLLASRRRWPRTTRRSSGRRHPLDDVGVSVFATALATALDPELGTTVLRSGRRLAALGPLASTSGAQEGARADRPARRGLG